MKCSAQSIACRFNNVNEIGITLTASQKKKLISFTECVSFFFYRVYFPFASALRTEIILISKDCD